MQLGINVFCAGLPIPAVLSQWTQQIGGEDALIRGKTATMQHPRNTDHHAAQFKSWDVLLKAYNQYKVKKLS